MRIPLSELDPQWLSSGPQRSRMGFAFLCPCQRHRQEVWMFRPMDGDGPATASGERRLYDVSGTDFDNLEVTEVLTCGEDWLFVKAGTVVVG